jgi:hypothetical protein
MGQWGEPFVEEAIYHIGDGKRIRVRKTFIDHFHTGPNPFRPISSKSVADMRLLVNVCVDGDISPENAAALREWILDGLKTEIPEFLRVAFNLEPSGQFSPGLEAKINDLHMQGARLLHAMNNLKPKGERGMGEKIELGCKAKDSVTGFIGTVTARCEYLAGESRVMIEGLAEGKPVELWVAQSRCEVVAE